MKQARATKEEWERLANWLRQQEEDGIPVPAWERVIFGYDVMFQNACDPTKDILEFKPEILSAKEDVIRLRSDNARLTRELAEAKREPLPPSGPH